MFSKFFLYVLLLICIYTYMINSIKDNNDTNFQKLPDNFNFELNGIQTVKPNLNMESTNKILAALKFHSNINLITHALNNISLFQKMFSKIFLSVLFLTCVYTYMHKSIKDTNYTNFQKLPDSFNFELNRIQTLKKFIKKF